MHINRPVYLSVTMSGTHTPMRYSLEDFNNIYSDGFDYNISDETHDIIAALASQVGAPDYVRTPNFSTHGRDKGRVGGGGRRNRNRRGQEMSDADWEDIRTFGSKPKAELSEEDLLLKSFRGELNKLVVGNVKEHSCVIYDGLMRLHDLGLADKGMSTLLDIACCSSINTGLFAELVVELSLKDIHIANVMNPLIVRFIEDEWMNGFTSIRVVDEEDDYDLFCDNNKENDRRLNQSRFLGKLLKAYLSAIDFDGSWIESLSKFDIVLAFLFPLEMEDNEEVALVFGQNVIAFLEPLIPDEDGCYFDGLEWAEERFNRLREILNEHSKYPSMSRQLRYALEELIGKVSVAAE